MVNYVTAGIIGVLLLAGLGTTYVLTKEQLPNTYICTTNNVTGIFSSFSASNKTAYWTINSTNKSSVCTNGIWLPLETWCTNNGVDCKLFLDDKKGMIVNDTSMDEFGNQIIIDKNIVVDSTTKVSIKGEVYNITYVEKPPKIKCICDKIAGCQISECLV